MNISNEIIKVLDALYEKFGIVIDWTSTNILPYLETLFGKFIKWEIASSIFTMVFWILLAGIAWLIAIPLIKKSNNNDWDFDYSGWPWVAIFIIIAACIFTIVAVININMQSYDICEAVNFPEKAIYDYITRNINTTK